jgi:hypothetical protein
MMISNFAYPIKVEVINRSDQPQESSIRVIVAQENGETTVVSVVVPACDFIGA